LLAEVRTALGSVKRAAALVVAQNGRRLWELAKKARSEDVLVYLAMTNFRKRFLKREIPARIRSEIRAFFGDLNTAQAKARELLFAAGDPDEIALARRSRGTETVPDRRRHRGVSIARLPCPAFAGQLLMSCF
jgi:hypothetical protein